MVLNTRLVYFVRVYYSGICHFDVLQDKFPKSGAFTKATLKTNLILFAMLDTFVRKMHYITAMKISRARVYIFHTYRHDGKL